MYINGACQSQIEPMIPEIPIITLGIAAAKFPGVLRVKLRHTTDCNGIPLVHFIFSQIMSILNLIEAKIGSVLNWPQDILRYRFYQTTYIFHGL